MPQNSASDPLHPGDERPPDATGRPSPFDLDALRAAPDLDAFDVEKILTTVPVRRPGKNEFFRVHPSDDYAVDSYVLEHESDLDRTTYWVAPGVRVELVEHLRKVRLYTCIDKRSNVFLWPAKLPIVDGSASARSWYLSGLRAAEEAKRLWVKIVGNKVIGAYDIVVARGDLGDPQWPDHTFAELIELAFRDRLIDSLDHAAVREINGEI
jgi:UDP-3-O-acyl-N-acetylglucosamine deacetylase